MRRICGDSTRRRALLFTAAVVSIGGCGLLGRSRPPLDQSQDPRIRQEVQARLTREPSIDAGNVRVEVNGGVVILHGSVRGIGAWQCAVATSGLVHGVRSVVDYLVIERGPRDVHCVAPRPDSTIVTGAGDEPRGSM